MSEPIKLFNQAGEEFTVYDVAFAQRLIESGDYTDQPAPAIDLVGDEQPADEPQADEPQADPPQADPPQADPPIDLAKVTTKKK